MCVCVWAYHVTDNGTKHKINFAQDKSQNAGMLWHDVGNLFLWVGVWVRVIQIPFSVFARNPHKGLICKISHETLRRWGKAKSQIKRTEESNQQKKKAVSKWEEGSLQESAVNGSRGKLTVRERRLLRPVDPVAGLANVRGWFSIPSGCVGISLEYTLVIAHRSSAYLESVTNFSLLSLGANLSPYLFVLFFFHILIVYVVPCVFVKKCEIPLTGDERNHKTIRVV